MSEDDQRLAELLRSAAASAEREAPAFDPARIVAAAHRRRPWLALGAAPARPPASRLVPLSLRPIIGISAVCASLVLLITLAAVGVFSPPERVSPGVIGTSTTLTQPLTSTTLPPPTSSEVGTTTTAVPPTTSVPPTTVAPTSTTAPTTTTTPPTSTTVATSTTTTMPPFTSTAMWDGQPVTLTYEGDQDVGRRFGNAHRERAMATAFTTDDPAFTALDGKSLQVFSLPDQYPGELVVDDGEQTYPEKGTWVFTPPASS